MTDTTQLTNRVFLFIIALLFLGLSFSLVLHSEKEEYSWGVVLFLFCITAVGVVCLVGVFSSAERARKMAEFCSGYTEWVVIPILFLASLISKLILKVIKRR